MNGYYMPPLSGLQNPGVSEFLPNDLYAAPTATALPGQGRGYGVLQDLTQPVDLGSGTEGGSIFDSMLGKDGWGSLALKGAGMLSNMYFGMKQYGLQEDMLKEQKRQFNMNWEAQKQLTNSRLSDRQNARNAAGPGHMSEAEYMKKWGVK